MQLTIDGGWEEVQVRREHPDPDPPPRVPSALLLPPLSPHETAVTRDDLDYLADMHDETGFLCVEARPGGGGVRFVGKAFKRPVGPRRETARLAAADVAGFWRGLYGDRWRSYFAVRMRPPWRLVAAGRGWRVAVWVLGRTEYVGGGRKALGDVYPSPAAAVAAYRRWVRERFGLFAPVAGYYLRRPTPGRTDPLPSRRRECRGRWAA